MKVEGATIMKGMGIGNEPEGVAVVIGRHLDACFTRDTKLESPDGLPRWKASYGIDIGAGGHPTSVAVVPSHKPFVLGDLDACLTRELSAVTFSPKLADHRIIVRLAVNL